VQKQQLIHKHLSNRKYLHNFQYTSVDQFYHPVLTEDEEELYHQDAGTMSGGSPLRMQYHDSVNLVPDFDNNVLADDPFGRKRNQQVLVDDSLSPPKKLSQFVTPFDLKVKQPGNNLTFGVGSNRNIIQDRSRNVGSA